MLDDRTAKKQFCQKNSLFIIEASKLYFIYTCHFHFCIFNLQSFLNNFFFHFSRYQFLLGHLFFQHNFIPGMPCLTPLCFLFINLFFSISKYSFEFTAIVKRLALSKFSVSHKPICSFNFTSRVLN